MPKVPAQTSVPEAGARRRARYLSGLVWHVGAFAIINAFFWVLDLLLGDRGLDWAFWITGVWAFAVAFHALAYYVTGLEERKYRGLLGEERGAESRQE